MKFSLTMKNAYDTHKYLDDLLQGKYLDSYSSLLFSPQLTVGVIRTRHKPEGECGDDIVLIRHQQLPERSATRSQAAMGIRQNAD